MTNFQRLKLFSMPTFLISFDLVPNRQAVSKALSCWENYTFYDDTLVLFKISSQNMSTNFKKYKKFIKVLPTRI